MARNENPPFPRGSTFYNGNTIDTNNLGGVNLEGMIWVFEDLELGTPQKGTRTGKPVTCMCVRNVGASAILPGQLVTMQVSGLNATARVDGKARTTAVNCVPVDEWLPAAGCPVNDLCWVVIEGPCMMLTDLAAGANNLIPEGTVLVALTAATSGATTAGRVAPQDLTGATAALGLQVQNRLGYALSARTTAQTNTTILVDKRLY